ncbi:MAG: DUF3883 domain-containing protein [Candidatus Cloacimonetes bacterium]|nr:DUF3883 domain-containing protein [Candidatus Cloacimonadota bacterium]
MKKENKKVLNGTKESAIENIESDKDYNPESQYRCTIIRGKTISKMDDLLPIYSDILNSICPTTVEDYKKQFDQELEKYITNSKTIGNHRTENVQQLLGLCYENDGMVYLTERALNYIKDGDQPAFFKGVCFKFQQPNGTQTIETLKDKIKHQINFRPYHFIIALLKKASANSIVLTKNEIAFYVLNSLKVLQGKVTITQVYNRIVLDRRKGIKNKVKDKGRQYSYYMQHINEQLDYLHLANLIRKDRNEVWLNEKEDQAIEIFIHELENPLQFDILKYDLSKVGITKQINLEWQKYYGEIDENIYNKFKTNIDSLAGDKSEGAKKELTSLEIGDEGEEFVLEYEKKIVRSFIPRLVNKINHHGKTKGLGYDVTSIEAGRDKENPEYVRYIEVKSTIRVNPPNLSATLDSITMTRNEWVIAKQHQSQFYIYRVYFTAKGTFINIIKNPYQKGKDELLYVKPITYRLEFGNKAIDERWDPGKND